MLWQTEEHKLAVDDFHCLEAKSKHFMTIIYIFRFSLTPSPPSAATGFDFKQNTQLFLLSPLGADLQELKVSHESSGCLWLCLLKNRGV